MAAEEKCKIPEPFYDESAGKNNKGFSKRKRAISIDLACEPLHKSVRHESADNKSGHDKIHYQRELELQRQVESLWCRLQCNHLDQREKQRLKQLLDKAEKEELALLWLPTIAELTQVATSQTTDVKSGVFPSIKPQTTSIEVVGITCNKKYQPETNAAEMVTSQTTDLKSSAFPSTKPQTSSQIQSASKKAVNITSNKACPPETNTENTSPDRTNPFTTAGVSCSGPLSAEMVTSQTTDVKSGALPSIKPQTTLIEVANILLTIRNT